ncbi:protein crumbs-like isoform X2 [Ruditapes philippinarum]|uniref:protein crumbs-like isoform X2 n=1 Tax=Ruditapes philippinarum TaxID=129788 RepID=UPI00295BF56A|nr:protein crumbs-like isoform X2 [Ruditapes philippinarum]
MDETALDYRYYNTDLMNNGQRDLRQSTTNTENIVPPEMQPFSTGNENIYEDTGSREPDHHYSSIYEIPGQDRGGIVENKKDVVQIRRSKLSKIVFLTIVFIILLVTGSVLLGFMLGSCTEENKQDLESVVVKGIQNTENKCGHSCGNGTCFEGDGVALCRCFPGYGGVFCEYDIDDCASSPCGFHGTCIDGNSTFTCICESNYGGLRCLEEWTLVFRGTAGAGSDIYRVWKDGENATITDETCMTTDVTSCKRHYRHPVVDTWKLLGITKVKLSFYNNNTERAYIVFNGTGSDITSWFKSFRIIHSSWTNMASQRFQLFSIFGNDPWRRFLISRHLGQCADDVMYTATIVPHHYTCSYDQHPVYPQFLYSTSNSYGYPGKLKGFAAADVMAIFIQY